MLSKLPYKHKYPQSKWGLKIVKILRLLNIDKSASIVDAPCGNGIIAWFVKSAMPDNPVMAFDLNEDLLKSPYLENQNIRSLKLDVFKQQLEGNNHVWLLINSLYCLPDKDELIEANKAYYKYIICLVPDSNKVNFKTFTKQHPDFQNPSLMSIKSTIDFFNNHNYRLLTNEGITSLPFHWLNRTIFFLKLPLNVKNFIFFVLDACYFFGNKQYRILTFERI